MRLGGFRGGQKRWRLHRHFSSSRWSCRLSRRIYAWALNKEELHHPRSDQLDPGPPQPPSFFLQNCQRWWLSTRGTKIDPLYPRLSQKHSFFFLFFEFFYFFFTRPHRLSGLLITAALNHLILIHHAAEVCYPGPMCARRSSPPSSAVERL